MTWSRQRRALMPDWPESCPSADRDNGSVARTSLAVIETVAHLLKRKEGAIAEPGGNAYCGALFDASRLSRRV